MKIVEFKEDLDINPLYALHTDDGVVCLYIDGTVTVDNIEISHNKSSWLHVLEDWKRRHNEEKI